MLFSAIKEFSVRFIGSSVHPSQIGANIDELQGVWFFCCNRGYLNCGVDVELCFFFSMVGQGGIT